MAVAFLEERTVWAAPGIEAKKATLGVRALLISLEYTLCVKRLNCVASSTSATLIKIPA